MTFKATETEFHPENFGTGITGMNPIEKCRLCGSGQLTHIHDLGEQYVSGFWDAHVTNYHNVGGRQRWPLTLIICDDCELLQLAHNAPQELLYSRHYWYRSGTSDSMREHLQDVVQSILYPGTCVREGDRWLDIGANDGTLLSFVPRLYERIGVEPAENLLDDLARHADTIIGGFWKGLPMKVNVITAIGMLYDLEDPNQFIADVAKTLAPDGIFVAQLMCLKHMLELKDVGNVCHEHLEFYSYRNLVRLLEQHGLEIFRVTENTVNGGSYRIFARHARADIPASVPLDEDVTRDDIYWFIHDIEKGRADCLNFVGDALDQGKTIWVYGASTKGNVILQYYGLTSDHIVAAADRNPDKHGLVMAGSGIPIKSEEEMRAAQPDYLLCLPWAFFDEFYDRELEWHMNGGEWLVPLPEFRVV
jgi:SAM-dependent methyltransferase